MKFFIVFTLFATAILATQQRSSMITLLEFFSKHNSDTSRIISGENAEVGQFPWQVAVHFKKNGGSFFCGGSLINEHWILTAAHCAQGATSFTLKFGAITLDKNETDRVEITTSTSIVHPEYNSNLNNDIALIKMENPIAFTDRIQPVKLPKHGSLLGTGEKLTVSGWGKISDSASGVSQILNFVKLSTISNSNCADVYGSSVVIGSTVCCKGKPEHSTCNGDSGGPLVIYNAGVATHVGVVSFVHISGCGSGNPSGFVRTESFLSWIHENTGIVIE